LSYFNHTAGRRFLPFGITAISKWFGDYLSLTTQGVLLCVLKLLFLQWLVLLRPWLWRVRRWLV
jgi:hypothetical protein